MDPRNSNVAKDQPIVSVGNYRWLEGIGRISGGVSDAAPYVVVQPDVKIVNFYARTTAASGDNRLAYLRYLAAGSGSALADCLRAISVVSNLAANGVSGAHLAAELDVAGNVTGLMVGVRASLGALTPTVARNITGTGAALQIDSYIAATNTITGRYSFIRVSDGDTVRLPLFLEFANAGLNATSGAAVLTKTAGAAGAMCLTCMVNGVLWFIPLSASCS